MLSFLTLLISGYTLADLKVLDKKQGWPELSAHLGDVAPSARDAEWLAIAERTSLALLRRAAAGNDTQSSFASAEAVIELATDLKSNKQVMSLRADTGLELVERCFGNAYGGETCAENLVSFVSKDADNSVLQWRAGKLARRHLQHWFAVRFFKPALSQPAETRPCADEDVKLAVLSALALPPDDKASKHPIADAQAISDTCWVALKASITEGMASASAYYVQNACLVIKNKSDAGKVVSKLCK